MTTRSTTAGGGETLPTLNNQLSTLNFLRTPASAPAREGLRSWLSSDWLGADVAIMRTARFACHFG
jgi:hypothetical protein